MKKEKKFLKNLLLWRKKYSGKTVKRKFFGVENILPCYKESFLECELNLRWIIDWKIASDAQVIGYFK